jgi:hypothetical protein
MQNKWLWNGLIVLGGLLILGGVFSAGFLAGRWSVHNRTGENWVRGLLFGGAHGATGVIEAIQGQTLTLKLHDDTTQTVLIDKNTRVERIKRATLGDLKIGDRVLVVGAPDAQGQIKARLIRVLDLRVPTPTPRGR